MDERSIEPIVQWRLCCTQKQLSDQIKIVDADDRHNKYYENYYYDDGSIYEDILLKKQIIVDDKPVYCLYQWGTKCKELLEATNANKTLVTCLGNILRNQWCFLIRDKDHQARALIVNHNVKVLDFNSNATVVCDNDQMYWWYHKNEEHHTSVKKLYVPKLQQIDFVPSLLKLSKDGTLLVASGKTLDNYNQTHLYSIKSNESLALNNFPTPESNFSFGFEGNSHFITQSLVTRKTWEVPQENEEKD